MKKFVAYYRVSTQKQGQSGLGLEAQQSTVTNYVKSQAGTIVASFTEVESGKKNERQQLQTAIQEAQKAGAVLVIAKLDRLSRNVSFIASLMDSGIEFVACDQPQANKFTIHIFAALAEQERDLISQRTKAALTALKDRGVKLGSPKNLGDAARAKSKEVRVASARTAKENIQASGIILDKMAQGWTLQRIADHLNTQGFRTRRGSEFQPTTVSRLAKR